MGMSYQVCQGSWGTFHSAQAWGSLMSMTGSAWVWLAFSPRPRRDRTFTDSVCEYGSSTRRTRWNAAWVRIEPRNVAVCYIRQCMSSWEILSCLAFLLCVACSAYHWDFSLFRFWVLASTMVWYMRMRWAGCGLKYDFLCHYLYWGDIQSLNEMVLLNEAFIILVCVDFDLYWSLDQWPALWVGVEWFVGFGYIGIRLSSFMWGLYYLAFVVLCVCTNVQICWVFFFSLSLFSFFLKPSAGHHLRKLDWAVVRPSSLPDCLWHITKVFRLIGQLAA